MALAHDSEQFFTGIIKLIMAFAICLGYIYEKKTLFPWCRETDN